MNEELWYYYDEDLNEPQCLDPLANAKAMINYFAGLDLYPVNGWVTFLPAVASFTLKFKQKL